MERHINAFPCAALGLLYLEQLWTDSFSKATVNKLLLLIGHLPTETPLRMTTEVGWSSELTYGVSW